MHSPNISVSPRYVDPCSSTTEALRGNEFFAQAVQVQNSDEIIKTNAVFAPKEIQVVPKLPAKFWDNFKEKLTPEQFYSKFRELILSNCEIDEEFKAPKIRKKTPDGLDIQINSTFKLMLRTDAVIIITLIMRCLESDTKLNAFEEKEKNGSLSQKEIHLRGSLVREKTRAILRMPECYKAAFSETYQYYLACKNKLNANLIEEDIGEMINESREKRKQAVTKAGKLKTDTELAKNYQPQIAAYINFLEGKGELPLTQLGSIQNSKITTQCLSKEIAATSSQINIDMAKSEDFNLEEFWRNFKSNLSLTEFNEKFKIFILANWNSANYLKIKSANSLFRNDIRTDKLLQHIEVSFQSNLRYKALKIISKLTRYIEIGIEIDTLKKNQVLDEKQHRQKLRLLAAEKNIARMNMTEIFNEVYNKTYKNFIKQKENFHTIEPDKYESLIKNHIKDRNDNNKYANRIKIKFDFFVFFNKTIKICLNELKNDADKNSLEIIESITSTSSQLPTKLILDGKNISINQGRLFDIITDKISENYDISDEKKYISDPQDRQPARYYFTQIPITYFKYRCLLSTLKANIIDLLIFEKEKPDSLDNIKNIVEIAFAEYAKHVLEHQRYKEIVNSDRKNLAYSKKTIPQMRRYCFAIKKKLTQLEKTLEEKEYIYSQKLISSLMIDENQVISRLKCFTNTEGEKILFNILSKPEYQELTGNTSKPALKTSLSLVSEKEKQHLAASGVDINALIQPKRKEYTKKDLNNKGVQILNSIYDKMRNGIEVDEIEIKDSRVAVSAYLNFRKMMSSYYSQALLLTVKTDLLNHIAKEDITEETVVLQKKEHKFFNHRLISKTQTFGKYAIETIFFSNLLEENKPDIVLDNKKSSLLRIKKNRLTSAKQKVLQARSKLERTMQSTGVTQAELQKRFENFLHFKPLEKVLVSCIFTALNQAASSSDKTEPEQKKDSIESLEGLDLFDELGSEDADLLSFFLNQLHGVNITSHEISEELEMDSAFVDAILEEELHIDISQEQAEVPSLPSTATGLVFDNEKSIIESAMPSTFSSELIFNPAVNTEPLIFAEAEQVILTPSPVSEMLEITEANITPSTFESTVFERLDDAPNAFTTIALDSLESEKPTEYQAELQEKQLALLLKTIFQASEFFYDKAKIKSLSTQNFVEKYNHTEMMICALETQKFWLRAKTRILHLINYENRKKECSKRIAQENTALVLCLKNMCKNGLRHQEFEFKMQAQKMSEVFDKNMIERKEGFEVRRKKAVNARTSAQRVYNNECAKFKTEDKQVLERAFLYLSENKSINAFKTIFLDLSEKKIKELINSISLSAIYAGKNQDNKKPVSEAFWDTLKPKLSKDEFKLKFSEFILTTQQSEKRIRLSRNHELKIAKKNKNKQREFELMIEICFQENLYTRGLQTIYYILQFAKHYQRAEFIDLKKHKDNRDAQAVATRKLNNCYFKLPRKAYRSYQKRRKLNKIETPEKNKKKALRRMQKELKSFKRRQNQSDNLSVKPTPNSINFINDVLEALRSKSAIDVEDMKLIAKNCIQQDSVILEDSPLLLRIKSKRKISNSDVSSSLAKKLKISESKPKLQFKNNS